MPRYHQFCKFKFVNLILVSLNCWLMWQFQKAALACEVSTSQTSRGFVVFKVFKAHWACVRSLYSPHQVWKGYLFDTQWALFLYINFILLCFFQNMTSRALSLIMCCRLCRRIFCVCIIWFQCDRIYLDL